MQNNNIFNVAELKAVYQSKNGKASERPRITSSGSAVQMLREIIGEDLTYREKFVVLGLNRANRVIHWSIISEGGISGTVADLKVIFGNLLVSGCSAFIISHNHPSGKLTPSNADIEVTNRVKKAGDIFDLTLLDHVIVTEEGYYSFADEGMIK
jgi:DNA repair protein RadC